MAFVVETFSGTSDTFRYTLTSQAFREEKAARRWAGEQIANDYCDTVMVYEEWSEAVDSDGAENTLGR